MPALQNAVAGDARAVVRRERPQPNGAAVPGAAPLEPGDQAGPHTPAESWWRRRLRATFVFVIMALTVAVAGGGVHIVRPGETLAEIAAKHDTSVAALTDANGLANPDLILIGQRLTIPSSDQIHIVVSGDTVGAIAVTYKTTAAAIVAANGLRNANLIKIGQQLVIPGPEAGANSEVAPRYHMVRRGESLASIAAAHGLDVDTVAAANGMRPDSVIFEGTRLRLTPGPSYEPPTSSGGSHLVARGETLGEIAARYNTTVRRLADLNGIPNPNLIRAGRRLVVPGGFQCPVPGARFFNDWGFPRSGGRFHQGNDMFAPNGTAVLAPVSGVVEQVEGSVGGVQFWLYGDDGNLYIGTHMSSFGASGRVTAGTVVGRVGDSGNARGSRPHLHFEVMIDGEENINPYPLLVAACR